MIIMQLKLPQNLEIMVLVFHIKQVYTLYKVWNDFADDANQDFAPQIHKFQIMPMKHLMLGMNLGTSKWALKTNKWKPPKFANTWIARRQVCRQINVSCKSGPLVPRQCQNSCQTLLASSGPSVVAKFVFQGFANEVIICKCLSSLSSLSDL